MCHMIFYLVSFICSFLTVRRNILVRNAGKLNQINKIYADGAAVTRLRASHGACKLRMLLVLANKPRPRDYVRPETPSI